MRSFSLALLLVCLVAGCRERRAKAPASGTYGPAAAYSTQELVRARVDRSAAQPWTNGLLSVIQTELSPATLFHARTNVLSFFSGMADSGLGAPTFIAIPTPFGPKIFKPGATIDPARLNESWLVVWFAGAQGWTNWDSPWLVTLQRKPTLITLGSNGLSFKFAGEAGYAALMPIYGYYKPAHPAQAALPVFQSKEKKKRVLTWEWEKALPADPLARARYWASALKEFPLYCEETFSVRRSEDAVVLRQRIHFLSWNDDWNTRHIKLAPISPVLAHAFREDFPAEFSKKPFDMEMFTPYGPVMGIEEVDSYDVTLPVLTFINETERVTRPDPKAHPTVGAALQKLRATATAAAFGNPSSIENPATLGVLAKALPYMDDSTRSNAAQSLRKFVREQVLVTNRVNTNSGVIEPLWAYAHYTGDWDLIRERWNTVKLMFRIPSETRWVGFGAGGRPELGAGAAECLAMARLAYKVADTAMYDFAAMMFARELARGWVMQRGTPWFREHQPYHTMEAMDAEVYLSTLRGGTAGWQIDGPKFPAEGRERSFENRWALFNNEDVARFHRGYFGPELRRELDALRSRWPEERRSAGDPAALPSLVTLRSLLLNETPLQLASNAIPEKFGGTPAGVIASCLSMLRTSHPTTYERLIPGGPASPFVAGLEREVAGPNIHLVQEVSSGASQEESNNAARHWPRVTWSAWQTPTSVPWNFGQVAPGGKKPMTVERVPLNWNTSVTVFR